MRQRRTSKSVGHKIEGLLAKEDWQRARSALMAALKTSPNDHWLITKLGTTFYERFNYQQALRLSEKAMQLAPRCPLVLWDYASCLDMVGEHRRAIEVWQKLLKRGVTQVAYGECGEGIRWARSLLNDCRYRIGRTYQDMGDTRRAVFYLKRHIKNRSPATPSIYNLSVVKRKLAELLSAKRP